MTLRRFRSGAGWITLAPLLLASPIGCQRARDPGASSLAKVPGSRPGQPCGDGQVACGVLCCRLNERCIDDRCYCTGMICGDECRPKPLSCAVVIRSQQRDHCNATAAGIGCGPRKPAPELDVCDIGVVHRELVDSIGDCDEARFLVVTAAACRAYRQKNAGRPLDEFDPDQDIRVTRHLDRFDAGGSLREGQLLPGAYSCPPLPAAAKKDRPGRRGLSRGK
jgi:hypothetical protein